METDLCTKAPPEWTRMALEEVCVRVTSGGTPSRKEPEFYQGGDVPWVKTQELEDKWIEDTEEHITEEALAASAAKLLPAETVLVAMYGATVGKLGLLRKGMACNQACCALIADRRKTTPRYLFYLLLQAQEEIKGHATGAAQQNISGQFLRKLRFPYPPLPEQKRIAHILGTLDDKIELNRRMCRTLEEMARALFKSWFVDFDPVRAKAAGRQPAGMDAATAALFPDSFVDSELGEIPEGWSVSTLGEKFSCVMGQSPPGHTYNEVGEGMPFYQGRADFGFRFPRLRVFCTAPSRRAHEGDTLLSVRAPVGDLNLAASDCAIGRGVAALRHKSGSASYTYYTLLGLQTSLIGFEANGTVFGSVSKGELAAVRCLAPHVALPAAFERFAHPLDAEVEALTSEARNLAQGRDVLLPRLLSGG